VKSPDRARARSESSLETLCTKPPTRVGGRFSVSTYPTFWLVVIGATLGAFFGLFLCALVSGSLSTKAQDDDGHS
jgi:hypothetical protein